jgi:hypothetical protein
MHQTTNHLPHPPAPPLSYPAYHSPIPLSPPTDTCLPLRLSPPITSPFSLSPLTPSQLSSTHHSLCLPPLPFPPYPSHFLKSISQVTSTCVGVPLSLPPLLLLLPPQPHPSLRSPQFLPSTWSLFTHSAMQFCTNHFSPHHPCTYAINLPSATPVLVIKKDLCGLETSILTLRSLGYHLKHS